jgi:hypothetical protein
LISKGDASWDTAEDYYKEAGQRLIELQKKKPEEVTWRVYVKEKCGISKGYANKLIKLANGTASLEDMRGRNKEAVRKHRTKQRLLCKSRGGPTQADISDALASLDPSGKSMDKEEGGRLHAWRCGTYFSASRRL